MKNQEKLDELKKQLQKAAILELTTIAPYLTAEFSIPKTDENGKKIESEAVNSIHSIFIEEMQHCAKVSKILYAIGGEVRFNGDTIPSYPFKAKFVGNNSFPEPYFGKRDLEINLESYSKESLETFLEIEKPDYLKKVKAKIQATKEEEYNAYTIGEFYQLIENNIVELFNLDPDFKLRGQYQTKDDIIKDLHLIAEQGEGNIEHLDKNNHFYKFLELYNEKKFTDKDQLDLVPKDKAYPVSTGEELPLTVAILIHKNAKQADYSSIQELSDINFKFNKAYTELLKMMEKMYNNGEDAKTSEDFRNTMFSLRPLGQQMMTIPYKETENGAIIYGAPSFEWQE